MFDKPKSGDSPKQDLHSAKLSNAIDKIKSLNPRERVELEDVDASCFSIIWEEFEQDRKSRPAGGTGKLQINYDSATQVVEVINLEKRVAPPAPTPPAPIPPRGPVPSRWNNDDK